MSTYADQLTAESASWLFPDSDGREEKFRRERIRHHKLIRDLLLDKLGTHEMDVLEVGGGPFPVSDLLQFRSRLVIDPLADDYATVAPCPDHISLHGEDLEAAANFDLAICTNSLDHVQGPDLVVENVARALRPGGYFAVMCAQNNALTHPHPAHEINLTARDIHRWCDAEFETVWELTWERDAYRYGHVLFEGRRGQPAFALLLRKCTGYPS